MHSPAVGLRLASVIFGFIGIAHVARLLLRTEIMIGLYHVPLWLSGFAIVAAAGLCGWLWRLSMPAKPAGAAGAPAE